jgi:hypothetical protein
MKSEMPKQEIIDSKALEAGCALGQEAFEIKIQPEIDGETSISNTAMYDWERDRLRVFASGVKKAVMAGGDAFHVVRYAVAHELGHAREARYFAERELFPWKFRIDPRCVLVAQLPLPSLNSCRSLTRSLLILGLMSC